MHLNPINEEPQIALAERRVIVRELAPESACKGFDALRRDLLVNGFLSAALDRELPDNLLTFALACADTDCQGFIVVQMAALDSLIEVIQRLVVRTQLALEVGYCLAPCIFLIRRSLR
ncbi:hypothetical protein [Limibacillus halophilus]|uniref:hypothetical protein n=1 Tax=Limibacillus halophilus TaxID=1579333 RepID=UPI00161C0BF5|nr:hypothetical protein [Limibacillus halophilus]